MEDLLHHTAARAIRYLRDLPERRVAPSPDAITGLERFDEPLPEHPDDAERVIALLDEAGSPATMASAGPRFFGFVIGGSHPVAVAASWLAAAWDQNAGASTASPTAAALEQVAQRWLVELFGLPSTTVAGFVTGGTMANMTALAAARHAVLARAGWDVDAKGLGGAPPVTVIAGDEVHPSLLKGVGLLGLGREQVRRVEVDGQGRMRADRLPPISGPTIVCTQAGNVNTGAFDPVEEIAARAHEAGAWVHVDGAFGLWAAVAPARAHLVRGVGAADSWATDAHKWLNTPYDSGLAFVRDPEPLRAAMGLTAAYLPDSMMREPAAHAPELSRRARGVEVWAVLRALGRSGLADLVERDCRHAASFARGLADAGYEILNDVVLNQVLVSFGDEDKTRRVVAAIQEDGTCWAGITVWQGRTAMRISVSGWSTTEEDVERSLAAMLRAAA
ncbi:MAG TPA: aminotransferase class V-fold PLP-dependent enzyme [Thermoleophilia bacterium]|nr:aminotransferase class V-fold PLP-dependent enzyme [Thermoleophilia bacterium]